jgi:hypothetical protein
MGFFTKQNFKNKIKPFVALAGLLLPLPAFAQSQVQAGLSNGGLQALFGSGGLTGAQSVSQLIVEVINIMLIFAGAVAIIFVIIGGYQYLTSGGNEESAEKGKKTLLNAIIGIVLIIMSFVIINVIVNLVAGGLS